MTAPLTPTTASDAELVAEWRADMEGVTPGPWHPEIEADDRVAEGGEDRQPEVYVCSQATSCDYTVVATMGRAENIPHMRKSFDADWIARCSPSGIASLLDRLDKLSAEVAAKERERDDAVARYATSVAEAAELRARVAEQRAAIGRYMNDDVYTRAARAEAEAAGLREAVKGVTDATSAYLPPDGISKDECLNRVLAATDNPEINAIMIGASNG